MNRTFFTSRTWPGFRSWVITVLSCTAIFEGISFFAWKNEKGSLFDISTAFIAIPAGFMALMVLMAGLWAFFEKGSFSGALGWLARLFPVVWIIPLIDLVRTFGEGLLIGGPRLNGWDFLMSIGTAGLLPLNSGYSIGLRFGIFGIVAATGCMTWIVSKTPWKSIVSMLLVSGTMIKLTAITSVLAMTNGLFSASSWNAVPVEIVRRAGMALSNGYWWGNLYERFPMSIDAQSAIATRLVSAADAVCFLGIVLIAACILFIERKKDVMKHLFMQWGSLDFLVPVLIGFSFAWQDRVMQFGGFTGVLSIIIFILLIISLRVGDVLSKTVSRLSEDETNGVDQLLTRGDLSTDQAKDMIAASFCFSLISSLVLGWPTFVFCLVFLSGSHLMKDRRWFGYSWMATVFRIVAFSAVGLMASFFLLQNGKITDIALPIVVMVIVYRVLLEGFWIPRVSRHTNTMR